MCVADQTSCQLSQFYQIGEIPWTMDKTFVTVVTVDPETPRSNRRSASCPRLTTVSQEAGRLSSPKRKQRKEPATVMLRNLPNRAKPDRLKEHLTNLGFGSSYESIYMPLDRKTGVNKGYAFVRFTDEAIAAQFNDKVEEAQLPSSSSCKRLTASFATYQGAMARASRTKSPDMPWFFTGSGLVA